MKCVIFQFIRHPILGLAVNREPSIAIGNVSVYTPNMFSIPIEQFRLRFCVPGAGMLTLGILVWLTLGQMPLGRGEDKLCFLWEAFCYFSGWFFITLSLEGYCVHLKPRNPKKPRTEWLGDRIWLVRSKPVFNYVWILGIGVFLLFMNLFTSAVGD